MTVAVTNTRACGEWRLLFDTIIYSGRSFLV